MFEIRQIIQRLRMGESARQIARSRHVGRATVDSIHSIALAQNWLDPLGQIPDDGTLATFFKTPRKAQGNCIKFQLPQAQASALDSGHWCRRACVCL